MTHLIATNPLDISQALSKGTTLVLAPHMDDAVLGCGGTLAKLSTQENVHVVYATDGARSPVPDSLRKAKPSSELCAIRTQEAKDALRLIGVPVQNLHFLNFPDGSLNQHRDAFFQAMRQLLEQIQPDYVLMPFRYDCHPDHVAMSAIATQAIHTLNTSAQILEYFIYYRLQLLPKKDIRTYIQPQHLVSSNIDAQSELKRRSLQAFKTQTTRFYSWQTRPLLSQELIHEVCTTPETFLQSDMQRRVFTKGNRIIPIVTQLEAMLKRTKSRIILFLETLTKLPSKLMKST